MKITSLTKDTDTNYPAIYQHDRHGPDSNSGERLCPSLWCIDNICQICRDSAHNVEDNFRRQS